jgi:Kef-type K+ transport system membrane component KefB
VIVFSISVALVSAAITDMIGIHAIFGRVPGRRRAG